MAVRYGTTRENVMGLTVVLADGQVITVGDVLGYLAGTDLPELSDLIVDFDRDTLERRDVMRRDVLEALAALRTPVPRVWIAALAAAAAMLALEPLLGRAHADRWRRLLDPNSAATRTGNGAE